MFFHITHFKKVLNKTYLFSYLKLILCQIPCWRPPCICWILRLTAMLILDSRSSKGGGGGGGNWKMVNMSCNTAKEAISQFRFVLWPPENLRSLPNSLHSYSPVGNFSLKSRHLLLRYSEHRSINFDKWWKCGEIFLISRVSKELRYFPLLGVPKYLKFV